MNPAKDNGRTISLDTILERLHAETAYIAWLRAQEERREARATLQCVGEALTRLESDIIALKGANNQ